MENMLYIKPHHLLDIFKLYGAGVETFIPDQDYHHNFYFVANNILKHHYQTFYFTLTNDDICTTCKYAKNEICDDFFLHNNVNTSKEEYNKDIDSILLEKLNLPFNEPFSFIEFLKELETQLSLELISSVWHSSSLLENQKRFELTNIGLQKYLNH